MASKQSRDWIVEIDNFQGGFAPAFFVDDYPSYGNKNMAGNMKNVDISNPIGLVPGPNMQSISGSPSDLISQFIDYAIEEDTTYAIGNTGYVYQLSSSTLTNDNNFPHLISGAVLGSSIAYYRGNIYYSWHNNSVGDVGRYDGNAFDDDFMSTIPTSASNLLLSDFYPTIKLGEYLFWGNKNLISLYSDGSNIFTSDALDLPNDFTITTIEQAYSKLWIGGNDTGSDTTFDGNKKVGRIFVWDVNSPSWEDEVIIDAKISAIYNKENILYVFFSTEEGISKLAIIDPQSLILREVFSWEGEPPTPSQISTYKNFIIWSSSGKIYAFGARDAKLPAISFACGKGKYSTIAYLNSTAKGNITGFIQITTDDCAKFYSSATQGTLSSVFLNYRAGSTNFFPCNPITSIRLSSDQTNGISVNSIIHFWIP